MKGDPDMPSKSMKPDRCESCGKDIHDVDAVYLSSEDLKRKSRLLCTKCFNETISESCGLDFRHPAFDPVDVKDSAGMAHKFIFKSVLVPTGLSIEAIEIGKEFPEGYRFQVLGDPEGDHLHLFQKLYERIQRGLRRKHLEEGEGGLKIGDAQIVRARISSDVGSARLAPVLVIDGKKVSWKEFGQMLLTYEGFQFKMEIYDRCEEK
jgi:hypothetical protein